MRIRKQAAKLLGWAYHSQFPSSYSPPPSEANAGELQCQLNLSPWDVIHSPHCTISQEHLEAANESSEISLNINGFEAEEKEEQKQELEAEEKEELEEKTEEKETEVTGVMQCKKTDGKRWHCKRPSKPPHSLCSYHLAQLRSYRARFEDQVSGDHRKKPSFDLSSNYYYYYSVLGPWWGKRRGPIEGGTIGCNESSESDENSARESTAEIDEGSSFCEVKCDMKKKKKKMMKRKRGRKPAKSRSLKSFL